MDQPINFQPIFDYIDAKHSEVTERFDSLENRVDKLQTSVDSLTKMVKDFRDEHIVLHRRMEVLETWAQKVAKQTGIPLPV